MPTQYCTALALSEALRILGELGLAPQSLDGVPDFLRQVPSKAPRSASSARSTER